MNKKNGFYIYLTGNTTSTGVDKKIDDQVEVLNNYVNCQKIIVPREKKNIFKSILWRMPFGSFGRNYNKAFENIANVPDYIYIRFVAVDRKFLKFLWDIRKRYPDAKILLEVATYPYGVGWLKSKTMWPFYFKDRVNRKNLKGVVDKVVTYSDDSTIFRIPTIQVKNGIIVDRINPIYSSAKNERSDIIRLLAVAHLQNAHGYERCIEGLAEYYKNRPEKKIEFHIVGDGGELNYYKGLVAKYKLDKYIFFYGMKSGDELEAICGMADIALGIFGAYKVRINKSSALKIREYLARGLPVISGCREDAMEKGGEKYFCIFPNDKSNIDMGQVIDFYNSIYQEGKSKISIREEIRDYAKQTIDMQVVMQPVIRYLLADERK